MPPTTDYTDEEVEEFYDQLQNVIATESKRRTYSLYKVTGTQKLAKMLTPYGMELVALAVMSRQTTED